MCTFPVIIVRRMWKKKTLSCRQKFIFEIIDTKPFLAMQGGSDPIFPAGSYEGHTKSLCCHISGHSAKAAIPSSGGLLHD